MGVGAGLVGPVLTGPFLAKIINIHCYQSINDVVMSIVDESRPYVLRALARLSSDDSDVSTRTAEQA